MRLWAVRFRESVTDLPPEDAALLITVGLVIGVFPIMFVPTVLCVAVAFVFRLNAPALQVVNSVSSPLQLALLIPLERIGARLLPGASGSSSFAGAAASASLHAVVGWAVVCVPLGVTLYFVLLLAVRRPWAWWQLFSRIAFSIPGISNTATLWMAAARERYRA